MSDIAMPSRMHTHKMALFLTKT